MREIKFRGKRVDNSEWVFGYYVVHDMSLTNHDMRHLIICNNQMSEVYPVIPETVGQFTGLQDKNGKDIYEGDILQSNNKQHIGIVHFDYGMFLLKDEKNESLPVRKYCYWKIIGNIHEEK